MTNSEGEVVGFLDGLSTDLADSRLSAPTIRFFCGLDQDLQTPVQTASDLFRRAGWLIVEGKVQRGESIYSFSERFFRLPEGVSVADPYATDYRALIHDHPYEGPTIAYTQWAKERGYQGLLFVVGGLAGVTADFVDQIRYKVYNAALCGARVSALVKAGSSFPAYLERHRPELVRVFKLCPISPAKIRPKREDIFAFESDMLFHLSAQAAILAGISTPLAVQAAPLAALSTPLTDQVTPLADWIAESDFSVYYEIPTTGTVNDMVIAQWDEQAVAAREAAGLGPVDSYTQVRILTGMLFGQPSEIEEIARLGWISAGYAKSVILPQMIRAGLLRKLPDRRYELAFAYQPLTKRLTAVEAKRSDWRKAYEQLTNCYSFADRSVVALDRAFCHRALRSDHFMPPTEIGLASLDALSEKVEMVVEPQENVTKRAFETSLISELLYVLRRANVNSYPFGQVFGATLTSANDPRIVLFQPTQPVKAEETPSLSKRPSKSSFNPDP
jgi:hypothetical protein